MQYILVDGRYTVDVSAVRSVILVRAREIAKSNSDSDCGKNGPICRGEKRSFTTHLRRRHSQIGRIALRTAAGPSTVFSKIGPGGDCFVVSKLVKKFSLAGQKFESRRSSPPRRPILRASSKRILRTG